MKTEILYEWWVETFTPDEYEDIEDCYDIDLKEWPIDAPSGFDIRLCLRRLAGNDAEGITEMGYAYIENGDLENYFCCGHKVPKRHHDAIKNKLK